MATKTELVSKVQEVNLARTGEKLSNDEATLRTEDVINAIEQMLVGGSDVTLGFAKIVQGVQAACTKKNPQTGEPIEVPEKRVTKWKAMPKFKEKLNS
ncbi:HU family DNA-binding protein [Lysinibacillus agricola]|uniref:HU family DNA-binding protein n=1 Tax=Lysinibacillus agricola TaxID=2590012 RepID=A0ABX7AMZ6_9BACI|nr:MULTISPECIES: HU family DNA-binding protein [Lysinibacillus]KOS61447.1 hypothetical protein AN161_17805 [Lysinibacillus sp. FJAT-14222]QQP10871.1 HU family DNA-binding protein [Lysinibacillus agricola]